MEYACCQFCLLPLHRTQIGICSTCIRLLPQHALCEKCGSLLKHDPHFHQCEDVFSWRYLITVSSYSEPLKSYLRAYKFSRETRLSRVFSRLLLHAWQQHYRKYPENKPTKLITVPLSRLKKWWRGFNQTELIAQDFAHWTQLSYSPHTLSRQFSRYAQKQLSASKRRENIKNQFICRESLNNERILLLDDIVTTGSTVNEICRVLYENGAKSVDVICICKTI